MAIKIVSDLNLNGNKVENLTQGTDPQSAVTVSGLQGALDTKADLLHPHWNGTTTQNNSYTGLGGEVTIDVERKTARVHDGIQTGGFTLAKEEVTETVLSNSSAIIALQNRVFELENTVDTVMAGLKVRDAVRVCTTANLTATYNTTNKTLTNSGTLTALVIDGVALVVGNRVLVSNQTTASQNGLYAVTTVGSASVAWVLTRATDADTSAEVVNGLYVFTTEGTVNANRGFALITPNPITLDTTALAFTQVTAAGQIAGGAGLTRTGNVVDIVSASASRLVVNPDNIDLAQTGIVAGTYRSVQIDVYGRAIAGSNPSRTGWTASTGTATRSAIATSTATTTQVAERLKALIDDLISLGILGV